MKYLSYVAAAALALAGGGCGVSLSSSGGVIHGDGPYRAAWQTGWSAVRRDASPYARTSTSPGVCNIGGNKAGCFQTDFRVAADERWLAGELRRVHVPAQYRAATALTLRALAAEEKGLTSRMQALRAGPYTMAQRDVWWRRSRAQLAEANPVFRRGYAAFPAWARPVPAPQL
jgi:hypothetical protein